MWHKVRSIAIVVAFTLAIEYLVGWKAILAPWTQTNLYIIAATTGLLVLTYVVRALRIYRYFRLEQGFGICLRMFVQHNMLLNMLPMRAGEFAFPVLMKRYFDMAAGRSVPALVWLRLLDLHALALILVLTSAFLVPWQLVLVLAVILLAAPVASLAYIAPLKAFLERRDGRMAGVLRTGLDALPGSTPELVEQWLWTFFAWSVKMAAYGWIIVTFASTALAPSIIGAIGGELVSVIPLHGPAALGTYESGVVAAMAAAGVSVRRALYGAVNLHLLVLCVSMLAGVVSLLIPGRVPLYDESTASPSGRG